MFISLYRSIKSAFRDFYRNIWLSFATILVIVIAIVSINFLIVINFLSTSVIAKVQEKVDVSVYFKPKTTEGQVYEIQQKLRALSEVKSVEYVSKGDALIQFKNRHRDNDKIVQALDELSENPLSATLIIQTHDTEDYPKILSFLDKPEYSDYIFEKNYIQHKDIIDRINQASNQVKNIALFLSIIFILISVTVVYNALRVMIYAHRSEIAIMKLVGASNWFTRVPFVIESVFYTIVAFVFSIAILYPVFGLVQPFLTRFLGANINLFGYYSKNFNTLILIQIGLVFFINILSSIFATRRYIKV